MKKTLKIISASVLVLSVCVTVFASCSIKDEEENTATTTVRSTDYTYSDEPITMQKPTQYVHEAPPVPTEREKTEKQDEVQTSASVSAKAETTQKAIVGGNVDEIQNGVTLITRTTPVVKGNAATIMIQGTPCAEYSIEYYENNGTFAVGEDFSNKTADSMGFVSWTFQTNSSCESGEKKIIIRETDSDKYIQTAIIVE